MNNATVLLVSCFRRWLSHYTAILPRRRSRHCRADDYRGATIVRRRSIDRDVGVLHHFAPDHDVVLDLVGKLRRRAADRLEAQFVERRLEIGQLHDLGNLLLQQRDDLWRGAGRRPRPLLSPDHHHRALDLVSAGQRVDNAARVNDRHNAVDTQPRDFRLPSYLDEVTSP